MLCKNDTLRLQKINNPVLIMLQVTEITFLVEFFYNNSIFSIFLKKTHQFFSLVNNLGWELR